MRVLVGPDKFAGTLSAAEAAAAVVEGWREVAPDDEITVRPLSDGGPGFLDSLSLDSLSLDGARRIPVDTYDPLGRPVAGAVLLDGETAYVESAQACGLHLLAPAERDPRVTTSYGLGPLISAAVEHGARDVVVGLGGSATNDAGAGMLAALDAAPLDAGGYALPYGGAALVACARLGGVPRLRGVRLVAATDVDNPLTGLHGASSVFGPQKGASRADVLELDAALAKFAEVLERDLPGCPPGLADAPGAGAAGGLGAAILALGGRCESGIGLVRRLSRLDEVLDAVDVVITGEGSFDHQSLRGKVISGVAEAARDRGLPCVVLAGRISAGRREAARIGVTAAHSLEEHFGSVEEAMSRPAEGLRALGARAARQWSR
ncbi:glycerate kinase [Planosporangium flavigriseum]|uniref:Glycerate kinase n=1 Tax=Planosporangium flavigriseum TaxID=373681 RepID=A0A8J3LGI9_9ACTN|nr:glycerate kinase [Planosporangium flavigriseum]NJC63307.1 glycerate kinase [Planosporangium flavigriseum]GIG72582.1 glycerate kinase [Planosporangium flavigriseum]